MKRYLLLINILLLLFSLSHRAGAQTNQTVPNGGTTAPVNFSGTGCTYNWTNSNPAIGLPASGTGDIPAFTATNNTNGPVTAMITATPVQATIVYVPDLTSESVYMFNSVTGASLGRIALGGGRAGLAISPNGATLYAVNPDVAVIDIASSSLTNSIPAPSSFGYFNFISIGPGGNYLYVPDWGLNTVSVISTATNTIVGTVTLGSSPLGVAGNSDGSEVFLANGLSNTVSIVNTASNAVISSIPVGANPNTLCISPDGNKLYVANTGSNTISVISTTTNNVVATIPVGTAPIGLFVSYDNKNVYVTNSLSNSVSVIDAATDQVISTIATGSIPQGVCVSADNRTLYVENTGDNTISVIDIPSQSTIKTISMVGNTIPETFGNFISSNLPCVAAPVSFKITVNSGSPVVTASTATGTISACVGSASVSPDIQQFTVSGSSLTDVITATAPPGFEISFSANGTYGSSVSLSEAAGTTNNTILYVRSAATDPAGNISGNVVLSTPGATSQNVAVSGIVNALPTVNAVASQTVNAGQNTAAINFTGTGNTFTWTNDTPGIGLPASGTGDIAAFTAVNNGATPLTATVTVTPASASYTYMVDSYNNNILVINVLTGNVAYTIPTGVDPTGVSASRDGSKVYISDLNPTGIGSVSVLNTSTNKIEATITVGQNPWGIVVSPDGSRVYVANELSNTVSVINTTSNSVIATVLVAPGPVGIAISPDGSRVYVACSNTGSGNVTVINTSNNTVTVTIPVGGGPWGIAVSPDGSRVYVANAASNNAQVINTSSNTVIANISLTYFPTGVVVSPDGSRVYITNFYGNDVSVIDAATNTVITTIPSGQNPEGISISPDGRQLYVVNANSENINVFDTQTNTLLNTIGAGPEPLTLGNFFVAGTGCSGVPITFTITVDPPPPTITASTATGNISACIGSASASPNIQQFTVSGSGLTGNITATAPTGFEISLSTGSGYGNTVTFTQTGGAVANTIVYVRSASSASTGNISGNIVLTSPGATIQNVAVTGIVKALPTVNPVPNQTVMTGTATAAINFTGTGNTFTWTNNTPGIGLAATGSGSIAAFTAVNTGTTPVTATVTVTPDPQTSGFAYIANFGSNDVSVINTTTNKVVTQIPVGSNPTSAAVSADGSLVYVTNANSYTVSAISTATNSVIATIPVGVTPFDVVISPDSKFAYVINTISNSISVINTSTNMVTSTITTDFDPYRIAISPDGSKLYVTYGQDGTTVSVINATTGTLIADITVGLDCYGVAVTPDGSRVYVANHTTGAITVINASNNTVTTTFSIAGSPYGLVVSPDGSQLYLANEGQGVVTVVNTATNTVVASMTGNDGPWGISVSPDGSRLYVTNPGAASVSAFNTATNTLITKIDVGQEPESFSNFVTGSTGCTGSPITFTITVNPAVPTITTTTPTGNISACIGSPSESPNIAQFTVTGSNLTGDITTTAPAGFELSTSINGPYYPFIINVDIDGSVLPTLMYIHAAASASTGNISGNIVLTSPGAATQNVPVTGVINPLPTVNPIANQTVAGGSPTTAINFTGTGSTFTWTNDTPGMGLPASGTGNIAPFNAVNPGNTPITATVVVTPISATGCSGESTTFTFTIDPAPPETISFKPPPIKTYGDPDFSPAATSSNGNVPITFVSDNTGVATIVNNQIHITGAGTTNITASQAGNDSYGAATPVTQQLIVNKAPLTLTADDKTKTLGQPNPVLTFSHTPFAYNEDPSVLTTQPVLSTIATTNSAVGQYVISIGDATSPNYDITQLPGTLTINPAPASIVIPNAFTPNGDGVNDVWNIQALIDFPQCLVSVYSRNGSLVFQSRGYGKPWDGTYNGSPVPTGTYYYIINPQEGSQLLSGYVAVLR